MNKEWLSKVWAYSKAAGIPEARAVQLSVLLWVNKEIGPIEDFDSGKYADFAAILDGVSPWPGKFVKSADRKKVKGVPRPDTDPTCYTFQEFWRDYGYKTGKPGSEEIWALYDEGKRSRIKEHLPGYVLKTTTSKAKAEYGEFKPARAMPQSYLRDSLMKYWKGDFEPIAREVVPDDAKYKAQYEAHVAKWTEKYPSLLNTSLYLCYEDFEAVRDSNWSKFGLPAIGPTVRDSSMAEAYLQSADSGKKVIDIFKKLCSDAPV
jgi:hypothetical protein